VILRTGGLLRTRAVPGGHVRNTTGCASDDLEEDTGRTGGERLMTTTWKANAVSRELGGDGVWAPIVPEMRVAEWVPRPADRDEDFEPTIVRGVD
jgi:hypothetical protein